MYKECRFWSQLVWGKVETLGAYSKIGEQNSGLSSRPRGQGFSPATKRVAPAYFYWKIEEK